MPTKKTETIEEPRTDPEEAADEGRAAAPVDALPEDAPAADGPDTAKASPVDAADVRLGPFTVLSDFLRDGVMHFPGEAVTFLAHEAQHVRDLVANRVLHPGTGADAGEAVEAAEAGREAARRTPPGA